MTGPTPDKVNILLVNDRPSQLVAWQAILADLEENLVLAGSGVEALEHLLETDFAAILLDVHMPTMDGFETAALIRSRPRLQHVPILFVTAINTQDQDRARGYALGAVDYIFTPIVPEILRAKVAAFVELHRKTQQVADQAHQLAALNRTLEQQLAEIRKLNGELTSANTVLRAETAERRRAEANLRRAQAKLEERVQKRTAELATANAELTHEIAERRLAERRREMQYTVTRAMADADSLAAAAAPILRAICQGLDWETAELWLVDAAGALSRSQAWPASLAAAATGSLAQQVWAGGKPVWLPDGPAAEAAGSAVGLPLDAGGEVFGVICFACAGVRSPDAGVLQLLAALASQIGQFIERKQAEAALRISSEAERQARRAAEQAARQAELSADRTARLQSVTARLSEALTPEQVSAEIVTQIVSVTHAAAGAVLLLGEGAQHLELVQALGYPESLLAVLRRLPLSAGWPAAEAARTGELLWFESAATYRQRFAEAARLRDPYRYQAALVAPLLVEGRSLGAIMLSFLEVRGFDQAERDFVLTLARQCAQALERARLFAEAKALNAELEQRIQARTAELRAANTELEHSREQLRHLMGRMQDLREEERARIAREIHDDLGGALTGLKLDLRRIRMSLDGAGPEFPVHLEALSTAIDDIVRSVRRIATELRPALLDDFGLAAAIEWQLEEFEQRAGIHSQLALAADDLPLAPDVATAVFRVFQEALTNVARHAHATEVHVSLEQQADCVLLQVRDNGRGIDVSQIAYPKSLGLIGMRERIQLIAGELSIHGEPGQGTTISVRVPLAAPANAEAKGQAAEER